MAVGTKEAALRVQREAKAVAKRRTAAPKVAKAGIPAAVAPPAKPATSGEGEKINTSRPGRPKGPKMAKYLIGFEPTMVKAIDAEWHRRELTSRSETIRALLAEALK